MSNSETRPTRFQSVDKSKCFKDMHDVCGSAQSAFIEFYKAAEGLAALVKLELDVKSL